MERVTIKKLLEVGIALSQEKDSDKLFGIILSAAMDFANCDAGTLYVRRGNNLVFKEMITKSMNVYRGMEGESIDLPPVELDNKNVCGYAALSGKLINIADVYKSDRFDFSGPRQYDALTGFKTTSMLVVPMENNLGDIIGVLQLINALDENNEVIPFDETYEEVISSLGSQTAICLANMNYAHDILGLLNSFVRSISAAIDERTPYNANHTRNMVKYADKFIDWINAANYGWHFTGDEKEEFLMSTWIHDIGKLIIPLEIMDKSTRLGTRLQGILYRFDIIKLCNRLHRASGFYDEKMFNDAEEFLEKARGLVERVNTAGFLTDEILEEVNAMKRAVYLDADGNNAPYFNEDELDALSVRKGTLTASERATMESHVAATAKMLSDMEFARGYERAPVWAAMHHELINGSGYPDGLDDTAIPREVRLLTILDIFDALTARDRPYKSPLPTEKALSILNGMAESGQLDKEILTLFKQSGCYE